MSGRFSYRLKQPDPGDSDLSREKHNHENTKVTKRRRLPEVDAPHPTPFTFVIFVSFVVPHPSREE